MIRRTNRKSRATLGLSLAAALVGAATALVPASTAQGQPHTEPSPDAQQTNGTAVRQVEPPKDLLRQISKQTGAKGGPSGNISCWQWTTYGDPEGKACQQWYGDDLWVLDQNDNGAQFRVHLETDYDKHRYCADNTAGWTECKYDHKEGAQVRMHGYFAPHWSGMHWPWSDWLSE